MTRCSRARPSQGRRRGVRGGERVAGSAGRRHYVRPALVEMPGQSRRFGSETFAPILYVISYATSTRRIELHNAVPQGLSSSIFTSDMREAERFLSARGSRLRDGQRQHRSFGRGDRWRIRRREGDRRRARIRLGTPGRPTCAAPPTRSTTRPHAAARARASSSMSD